MQQIITAVAFSAIAAGSFTDMKVHEVPDWLNYGLLAFGIGANALLSIAFWTWTYIAYSLLGFLVFFAIACFMFYAGQWGGGDSKMLLALGAVFGFPFSLSAPFVNFSSFLISFWFNLLVAGVFYAIAWSVFLAVKNRKKFLKEASIGLKKNVLARRVALAFSVLLLIVALFFKGSPASVIIAATSFLVVLSIYLSLFSKAIERAGMLRTVLPSQLTEGDWIAKNVVVGGKIITGPKDLGVSKKQIAELKRLYSQKRVGKVLIKVGIPFVPSFLIAFMATIAFGNLFIALLRLV